ncbi:MAG: Transcriptional regulator, AsnC family, partial [uncultured Nocardioides sp.]
DHRHRVRQGRRRAHPGGGRGDRGARGRQRGLLRHRPDRPHRPGAGDQPRRHRLGGGRQAQQGRWRHRHRDPHRLPRLLPARPRVGVLARPRL